MEKIKIDIAVMLIAAILLSLGARALNPSGFEIGIYQLTSQILITEAITLRVYIFNGTKSPQVYEGDLTDDSGNLIFTGDWEIALEEVKNGAVIASKNLGRKSEQSAIQHTIQPLKYQQWELKVPVKDLTDHPGNFRFRLRFGNITKTEQLFRIVESLKIPEYIEMTYTTDKTDYYIGEPIKVRFFIKNNDTDDFRIETGADYRGSTRPLRFYFTAENEKGQKAIDPEPVQMWMGGLGGPKTLKPGYLHEVELPLNAYLGFTLPGNYTVKGYQDIGFGEPAAELGKVEASAGAFKYSYGGSFKISIITPDSNQIAEIIKSRLKISDRYDRRHSFSLLHNPMYLNPLEEVLKNESDEGRIEAIIAGIGSILTPEATEHLIKLASDKRTEIRTYALQNLFYRMPPKQREGEPNSNQYPDWRTTKIKSSWEERFRSRLPDILKKSLASDSLNEIEAAASCLSLLGEPNMMQLLANTADKIAPKIPVPAENTRIANRLANSVNILTMYGFELIKADNNSSPGRLAIWANSIPREKKYHTEQWENLLLEMMNMDCDLTQENAICLLPVDFSKINQIPWKKLLSSKNDLVIIHTVSAIRQYPPENIEAIIAEVLNQTDKVSSQMSLKQLLEELKSKNRKY